MEIPTLFPLNYYPLVDNNQKSTEEIALKQQEEKEQKILDEHIEKVSNTIDTLIRQCKKAFTDAEKDHILFKLNQHQTNYEKLLQAKHKYTESRNKDNTIIKLEDNRSIMELIE